MFLDWQAWSRMQTKVLGGVDLESHVRGCAGRVWAV